jgi:hypothetical protein
MARKTKRATAQTRGSGRSCPLPKPAQAAGEHLESARIVEGALDDPAQAARARLLADLLFAACGPSCPPRLAAERTLLVSHAAAARSAGVGALGAKLWWRLAALVAERLAVLIDTPAALYFLEHDAHARGLARAAAHFGEARRARFRTFDPEHARIDEALLSSVGIALDAPGVHVERARDRSITSLARDGLRLSITGTRTGVYGEEGRRGGYGYLVRERYERGAARGMLCSPWHDGEEYVTEKPWLVWVLECAGTIARPRATSFD